jgi:hypothetical protein
MRPSIVRLAVVAAGSILASVALAQSNNGAIMRVDSPVAVSPGAGADKSEARQPGKFSGIDLRAPVDVTFSTGANTSVTVSGPADVVPLVLTTVKDNVLTIQLTDSVMLRRPIKVTVTGPSLLAVSLSGSGSLNASGLSGDSLNLDVSGSGSIVASGRVATVNVSIKGSGGVDARSVHAKTLNASMRGSGDLRGYAANTAIVSLTGSGDVRIVGNPPTKIVNRTGSGDVHFE